jgi:nucleotide-binding universal stress UspA family protein
LLTVLSYQDLPVDEESGVLSDPLHPEAGLVDQAVGAPRQILEDAGYAVIVRTRLGDPAEEIIDETQEWGPDLLVLGRRRMRADEQRLLGSVSQAVIRAVSVPVLLSV